MIPYNQLSLADIFSDCQEIYESDKPAFLSLLQEHIGLDVIVPPSNRISGKISRSFLKSLLALRNPSARPLTLSERT